MFQKGDRVRVVGGIWDGMEGVVECPLSCGNSHWVAFPDGNRAIGDTVMEKISPAHYASGRKYEPIKVIHDWGLNYHLGNVIKYVSRAGRKTDDPIPDLEKAIAYLQFEIARVKGEWD